FYKALANPVRLRIAAALADGERTLPELARISGEPGASVPRHLAVLVAAGVALDLGRGRYGLDADGLRERSRRALASPRRQALAGARDERSRVLAAFFRQGRLPAWPAGDTRKQIVLDEIASRFEAGRVYDEREVNELIKPIFDDYTSIRR